jgi:membrane protein YdbS with pleckstrin-like domain
VLRTLEVRRLAYQVRTNDVSLRSGVITHRVESVPFARVQHVRVNRGAIERALGLATLEVSSAGPDITIPGLAEEDAARIKLLVTERAGVRENDGDMDVAPPPPDPPTLNEPPSDPPPPDMQPPPNEPAPPTPS